MLWIVALWGLAEATFFFIVPDVMLTALAIQGMRRAFMGCAFALVGAMLGGAIMYFWGATAQEHAARVVEHVPAISPEMMRGALHSLATQGVWAMIIGPLSGTPFKVYSVQAATAGIPFHAFLIASIPARIPRFLLVTIVAGYAGRVLRRRLSPRAVYAVWLAAWIVFYTLYFWRLPS